MSTIGKQFMEQTKYQYLGESDQDQGLPQPPLELAYPSEAVLIDLPKIEQINVKALDLTLAMEERKSVRKYRKEPLTMEELAYLLWYTQGVKAVNSRPATMRTVPSAGARHCFETYLMINHVSGLTPGLYKYVAMEHALIPVSLEPNLIEKVTHSARDQIFVARCAVVFIWTAVAYRMQWRYGERSYRYIHLDAGHVCQNLYLACQAIESGVCAIAAFDDDKLNTLLGLDGEEQFAIYLATAGKI